MNKLEKLINAANEKVARTQAVFEKEQKILHALDRDDDLYNNRSESCLDAECEFRQARSIRDWILKVIAE